MTKKKPEVEEKPLTPLEDHIKGMIEEVAKPIREKYEDSLKELQKKTEKVTSEVEDRLRSILAQMAVYVCYYCGRELISGKDAIYGNFEGKKFCSHDCIDKNKEKEK